MAESAVNGIGVQTGLSATTGAAVGLTLPTYTDVGPEGSITRAKTPRHAQIGIEGNSVRSRVDDTGASLV